MGEEVTSDLDEVRWVGGWDVILFLHTHGWVNESWFHNWIEHILIWMFSRFNWIYLDLWSTVNAIEVLEKRRVDHCLVFMEGLAEGQAGARLACGEVFLEKKHIRIFISYSIIIPGYSIWFPGCALMVFIGSPRNNRKQTESAASRSHNSLGTKTPPWCWPTWPPWPLCRSWGGGESTCGRRII